MRRIAIANQKGGCGKTTTAVCLALCLKDMGNRVLVTDMDPQGSTTQSLYPNREAIQHTVYELLMDSDTVPVSSVLTNIDEGLDLLPADVILSTVEQLLSGRSERESRLRKVLSRVDEDYDYVIIDSPPNVGILTFNALMAADEIIIPVDPSLFSLQGVGRVTDALDLLENINGHTTTYKVLATMYDSRTRISRELLAALKSSYEQSCFKTIIRNNVTLKESTGFGVPITQYRGSRGLSDYKSLANEVAGNDATQKFIETEAMENFLAPRRIGGGILFSYMDSEADSIVVQGDFNSWNGGRDALLDVDGRGLWQRVGSLRPGTYRYRFVVDERTVVDPNNNFTEYVEEKGLVSVVEV